MPGQNGFGQSAVSEVSDVELVELTVPLGDVPKDANSEMLHLNVHLTRQQSYALRRIRIGLNEGKETCKTGQGRERLVHSPSDAIRWLLESV